MDADIEKTVKLAQIEVKPKIAIGFAKDKTAINKFGRPRKEFCISDLLRNTLQAHPLKKKNIINKLLSMAEHGDLAAINVILDRLEGKPIIAMEHAGNEGEPIEIKIIEDAAPDAD